MMNPPSMNLASQTRQKKPWRKRAAVVPLLGAIFLLSQAMPMLADSIDVTSSVSQVNGSTWNYTYTLSGSLSSGDLLAIYFPLSTSSNLNDVSSTNSDFTTSVLQPDASIPADGEYDIVANSDTSTFAGSFAVTFTYSGSGTPGSQDFTLYDPSFATIESGRTSAVATPEPRPLALLIAAGGIFLLLGLRRSTGRFATFRRAGAIAAAVPLLMLPLAVHAQTGPPGGGTPPTGGVPPTGGGPGGGGGTTTTLSGMTIGPYELLSSYRASQYQYYYTYTTSVTNSNSTPYTYVYGTVTSSDSHTVVISASVEFGLVPAGGSASGFDAFTILQDRRYAFNPSSLTWTFSGSSSSSTVGTSPSATTVSASSVSAAYGTGINLSASVSPATATGSVTFYDGPMPAGTATLSSGTASLSNIVLATGRHNISAIYSGDTTYASSSSNQDTVKIETGGAVATCSGLQKTALVVCLANAFEATLTSSQLATAQLSYTLAHAEVWSNLPSPARNGLEFSSLSTTQLAAALQLAQAALSSQGYTRMENIIGANGILGQYTSGYGAGFYYIAILGTPSTSSAWQLQIGGHHLAFNHTFNGQYTSATPYFIGNEPAMFKIAGTLYEPLQGPRDAAYAVTRSIYGNSAALLSGTFDDVLMGSSGVDAYPHTYPTSGRGILYTSLTSAQQAQVKTMIEAWVKDMDAATADSLLKVYEDANALAQTYVGYSGDGTLTTQGDYIRVDGPRVWIEFCVQNGIVFNQSYHFHSIWRDKTADYGGDFSGE